jgi:DNA topoisomerase I
MSSPRKKPRSLADQPPVEDRVLGVDPASGLETLWPKRDALGLMSQKSCQNPRFLWTTEAPKKRKKAVEKPKTASLFQTMDIETIDLETQL